MEAEVLDLTEKNKNNHVFGIHCIFLHLRNSLLLVGTFGKKETIWWYVYIVDLKGGIVKLVKVARSSISFRCSVFHRHHPWLLTLIPSPLHTTLYLRLQNKRSSVLVLRGRHICISIRTGSVCISIRTGSLCIFFRTGSPELLFLKAPHAT